MIRFLKAVWEWFTCAELDDWPDDDSQDAVDQFGFPRK